MLKRTTFGDRMALLKNVRHERFAQGLAKGKPASTAYEEAGYKPSRSSATELRAKPNIGARVAELSAKAVSSMEVTIASLVDDLEEDRQMARDSMQASAAIAATMGKAKLLGLIVDQVKADVATTARSVPTAEELVNRKRAWTDRVEGTA